MSDDQPNGCGPTWLPKWFPDGPNGEFKEACNAHDGRYEIGGGILDRFKADWYLFIDAVNSVKHLPLRQRLYGYLLAGAYFIAVLLFGWFKSFNWRR